MKSNKLTSIILSSSTLDIEFLANILNSLENSELLIERLIGIKNDSDIEQMALERTKEYKERVLTSFDLIENRINVSYLKFGSINVWVENDDESETIVSYEEYASLACVPLGITRAEFEATHKKIRKDNQFYQATDYVRFS